MFGVSYVAILATRPATGGIDRRLRFVGFVARSCWLSGGDGTPSGG